MKNLVELLNERNKYLEQFYSLNKKEISYLEKGIFENLKSFYERREVILNAINNTNDLMKKFALGDLQKIKFEEKDKSEMIKASKYKDQLAEEILCQNLEILSFVEEMKIEMIKDIVGLAFSREDMRSRLKKQRIHSLGDCIYEFF